MNASLQTIVVPAMIGNTFGLISARPSVYPRIAVWHDYFTNTGPFTPNRTVMQTFTDAPGGYKESRQEIVEIKLWEVYLLYNRRNLYNTLSTYSLDNGPVEKDHQEEGRVSFRFMSFDWERTVKQLLYDNRIPVIIQSNALAAVKVKGGQEAVLNF